MNDYKKYWIWLSTALGAAARADDILSAYPEPHKIFEADRNERIISGCFTKTQLDRLEMAKMTDALSVMSVCEKNGWRIITPDDSAYPSLLDKIPNKPLVLYVDGDLECVSNKVTVGVVGTRKPCYESVAIARSISRGLAAAGAVVVSGGALGIDSAAHEGALDAGGKTVCVLGCGLGTRYLMEKDEMRRRIAENGALISEFAPFTEASRTSFPMRNRIISGLSHGVLVVEAGEKSGSLITARCANEQGREVFAIPGSVISTAYSGANKLIRDGAKAATCAADILQPFSAMYPDLLSLEAASDKTSFISAKEEIAQNKKPQVIKKECQPGLDPVTQSVYNLFGEEPLHPDEICAISGLSPAKVISALMQLEMADFIEQTEGKNYTLINNKP